MNLISRKEASEILGIKTNTLYKWQRLGKIKPFTHINGRPRYLVADLAEAATSTNNFKKSKK